MKTILVDAWNTLFTENGLDKEMQKLLDEFPNPKIVLTNANQDQIKEFGIDKSPYEIFTLAHEPNKTDPVYYEEMFEELELEPEDVIYFEHDPEAVESARSNGIKTHQFNYKKRDLKRLEAFLDNNLRRDYVEWRGDK